MTRQLWGIVQRWSHVSGILRHDAIKRRLDRADTKPRRCTESSLLVIASDRQADMTPSFDSVFDLLATLRAHRGDVSPERERECEAAWVYANLAIEEPSVTRREVEEALRLV